MPDQPAPCACPTPPRHAATCPATADLWPGVAPSGSEPDPLAPFRALADRYAAKAAESTRHAKIADDDEKRLATQGIAAGWRSAEFLLRHTLNSLDTGRTTPDNPTVSGDARRRVLAFDAFNAVDRAINTHGQWLPLTVREAIADAVLAVRDQEMQQLRAELDALRAVATGYCPHCGRGDCAPTPDQCLEQTRRADTAEAERDGAYRERARLVAYLASLHPSHIGHTDPSAPDWAVVIVETPAGQMSWHVAPRDLDLFAHVTPTGPAFQGWDGHTTDEKYERLRTLTAGLTYPCACGDQWPSPLLGCGHTAWKCWPDADQPTETPS